MKINRSGTLLLALLALFPARAHAQQSLAAEVLHPGDLVRYSLDNDHYGGVGYTPLVRRWQSGVMDSLTATHLWLQADGQSMSVPIEVIQALELRTRKRHPIPILATGALGGAALGAVTAMFISTDSQLSRNDAVHEFIVPMGTAGLGMTALLLPWLREGWSGLRLR